MIHGCHIFIQKFEFFLFFPLLVIGAGAGKSWPILGKSRVKMDPAPQPLVIPHVKKRIDTINRESIDPLNKLPFLCDIQRDILS